jgi:hypothetical protein
MSLFKTAKKYEKESEESVKVKAQLTKHLGTYSEARKAFEGGRAAVISLTSEVNALLQSEGHSRAWHDKETELKAATLARDKPLVNYTSRKQALELELSQLTRFFIAEELERWTGEADRVKSEKIHKEVAREPEEAGTFSIGRPHRILTNAEGIRLFREKSQENLNHIRDLVRNSIPEIEQFISTAQLEMQLIDLTPKIIELDAIDFERDQRDLVKESGRMAEGVLTADGGVEIRDRKDKVDLADQLIDAANRVIPEAKYIIARDKFKQ